MKTCKICGIKQEDREFFFGTFKCQGISNNCQACRDKKRRLKIEKRLQDRTERIKKIGLKFDRYWESIS
jgi:hypothetical protein